jgi:CHAT domain
MYEALRNSAVLPADAAETKSLRTQYEAWGKNAAQRQRILMQLAPRRLASAIEFPPWQPTAELQKSLAEGEALVVFHRAAGDLYGFLITQTGTHVWQLGDLRQLGAGIADLLQALGNSGLNRPLTAESLQSNQWSEIATDAYTAVFKDARLDLAKTTSLVIVPDDLLWYLPFDALVPDVTEPERTLADRVPLRYGPTAALALHRPAPLRRAQHTGIAANELEFGTDAERGALIAQLAAAVPGPLLLPVPMPESPELVSSLLDTLVVLDSVDAQRLAADRWIPLPRSRGNAAGGLQAAVPIPFGGPQRVVMTGLTTAAEQGLKASRRDATREMRPGGEVFHALCGLMAGGARTVLVSRWRTGGRTNLDLTREFTRELPQRPAVEAWQRACLLAREAPLNATVEPRLRTIDSGAQQTASHPFFWAGYLLVDTSPRREPADGAGVDTKPPAGQGTESETKANDSRGSGDPPPPTALQPAGPPETTLPPPEPPASPSEER